MHVIAYLLVHCTEAVEYVRSVHVTMNLKFCIYAAYGDYGCTLH